MPISQNEWGSNRKTNQFWDWICGKPGAKFPYLRAEDMPQVPYPIGYHPPTENESAFSPASPQPPSSPSSTPSFPRGAPFYCPTCDAEKDYEEVRMMDRSTPGADGWEVTCGQCGELLDED